MYPKGRGQGLGDNLSSIALEVSLSGSAHLKHIEGKARENLPANFGFSCRKFQPGSVGISAQTNAHILSLAERNEGSLNFSTHRLCFWSSWYSIPRLCVDKLDAS